MEVTFTLYFFVRFGLDVVSHNHILLTSRVCYIECTFMPCSARFQRKVVRAILPLSWRPTSQYADNDDVYSLRIRIVCEQPPHLEALE